MKPIKSKLIQATVEDIAALQELAATTFYDTYHALNPPGIVEAYIKTNFTEAAILEELQTPKTVFFILWIENQATGYIKLRYNTEVSEQLGTSEHLELERIYVRKEYQGQSFGKFLLQQAQTYSVSQNCTVLWLGVWSRNEKALAFYQRQGFERFGSHIFWMDDDAQEDFLMRKLV
jgi:diamine N-acetyltransferase